MEPSRIRVKRLSEDSVVPRKASDRAAGFDIHASESVTVTNRVTVVGTGIAIECPPGHYARIAPRSGLAMRSGLCVAGGVIDPDYTGEVKVLLYSQGHEVQIKKGDRIAQIIFEKYCDSAIFVEGDLPETERGDGGFGSTGK